MAEQKLNGKEHPDMTSQSRKESQRRLRQYAGNARFIELGDANAPFRSLINADELRNVRFEHNVQEIEPEFDDDGAMTKPPQQIDRGWIIIIEFRSGNQQTIGMVDLQQGINVYNTILDMIAGTGIPMARMQPMRVPKAPSDLIGPDGMPIADLSDEEKAALALDDEIPPLSEEELDALENPEIDVDEIADAIEEGLGISDEEIDEIAVEALEETLDEIKDGD